jgi:hypothetical protein
LSPPDHSSTEPWYEATEAAEGEAGWEGPSTAKTDRTDVSDACITTIPTESANGAPTGHVGPHPEKPEEDIFSCRLTPPKLVVKFKKDLKCDTCGGQLRGDGNANGTYRLKCSSCKKTMPLTKKLANMKRMNEFGHKAGSKGGSAIKPMTRKRCDIRAAIPFFAKPANGQGPSEAAVAEAAAAKKEGAPEGTQATEADRVNELTKLVLYMREEQAALRLRQADLEQQLATQKDCLVGMNEFLEALWTENRQLRQQLSVTEAAKPRTVLQRPTTEGAPSHNAAVTGSSLPTYASLVTRPTAPVPGKPKSAAPHHATAMPQPEPKAVDQKWTTVARKKTAGTTGPMAPSAPVAATSTKAPRSYPALKPEELERVLVGLSPRASRHITAVYAMGMRANKIATVKRVLAGNCGISLRNVPSIGFIGRSIAEFHVYVDAVEEFKKKLSAAIPAVSFVDLDPLDPALFKDEAVIDKIAAAAQKQIKRLQQRLEETPIAVHRRYMSAQLERARNQLARGEFVPRESTHPEMPSNLPGPMELDGPPSAAPAAAVDRLTE